jgi:hypothetical protein
MSYFLNLVVVLAVIGIGAVVIYALIKIGQISDTVEFRHVFRMDVPVGDEWNDDQTHQSIMATLAGLSDEPRIDQTATAWALSQTSGGFMDGPTTFPTYSAATVLFSDRARAKALLGRLQCPYIY